MKKNEIITFLKDLSNNDLFSKDYKDKFKEIAVFIEEKVEDNMDLMELASSIFEENEKIFNSLESEDESNLKIVHNEEFLNGKNYEVYTDGGCLVNPGGPGGYGVVILDGGLKKSFSQGFIASTNNRMELRGPIKALSVLPEGSNITLYSDSKYFCNSVNQKWIDSWLKNNWKNGTIKNIDLWKEFIALYNKHHVKIIWVKGHADTIYNEECDKLATKAYSNTSKLIKDEGFE